MLFSLSWTTLTQVFSRNTSENLRIYIANINHVSLKQALNYRCRSQGQAGADQSELNPSTPLSNQSETLRYANTEPALRRLQSPIHLEVLGCRELLFRPNR